MSVALLLVVVAVTHQGYVPRSAKLLQETQRKFLPMILNDTIALVDASGFAEFLSIIAAELSPGDEVLSGASLKALHLAQDLASRYRSGSPANTVHESASQVCAARRVCDLLANRRISSLSSKPFRNHCPRNAFSYRRTMGDRDFVSHCQTCDITTTQSSAPADGLDGRRSGCVDRVPTRGGSTWRPRHAFPGLGPTCPEGPTRSASAIELAPVPQPISTTRSPCRSRARSSVACRIGPRTMS
jgi:hypothetical protein